LQGSSQYTAVSAFKFIRKSAKEQAEESAENVVFLFHFFHVTQASARHKDQNEAEAGGTAYRETIVFISTITFTRHIL
jgi:hypothetical protein